VLGLHVGMLDGEIDGFSVGIEDGVVEVGEMEGSLLLGDSDGRIDGESEVGELDGVCEGLSLVGC